MGDEHNHLLTLLDEMDTRYEQIEQQISDPAIAKEPSKLIALSKERGKIRVMVLKYREYKKAVADSASAGQIANDPATEADLRALAEEEMEQLAARKDQLLDEIQNTLVMADDLHVGSVIMEIRAGTGGEEAALFARDLYDMYCHYAADRRWRVEQLDFSPSEKGGFREIIFNIKGEGVWAELGYEGGGHRVQRVPETEAQGRIHTSAATVAVLSEPEEVDIQINPADVIENVCRAGGPGGQNVNKVSSAIRLEHIPTGITVNMREESSQHKNRAKAWRILKPGLRALRGKTQGRAGLAAKEHDRHGRPIREDPNVQFPPESGHRPSDRPVAIQPGQDHCGRSGRSGRGSHGARPAGTSQAPASVALGGRSRVEVTNESSAK